MKEGAVKEQAMEKEPVEEDPEGKEAEVRFWGTRGSCAAPFPDRMEFGGNTSCVSVRWPGGLALFDGGTGIAAMGEFLEEESQAGRTAPVIHIFISHLHLDHVCGLPFFSSFYRPGRQIHLYGCGGEKESFREALCRIAGPPCWPLTPDQGAADVYWHDLTPGCGWTLDGTGGQYPECRLSTMAADHPDGSMMYRLEVGRGSVVYGLDCELTERVQDSYESFAAGCDLLIFDGMYTQEEYPRFRGFGHSAWQRGVELGKRCQAGLVCISHHDWGRRDWQLREMERQAKRMDPNCLFARENMRFGLTGHGAEKL